MLSFSLLSPKTKVQFIRKRKLPAIHFNIICGTFRSSKNLHQKQKNKIFFQNIFLPVFQSHYLTNNLIITLGNIWQVLTQTKSWLVFSFWKVLDFFYKLQLCLFFYFFKSPVAKVKLEAETKQKFNKKSSSGKKKGNVKKYLNHEDEVPHTINSLFILLFSSILAYFLFHFEKQQQLVHCLKRMECSFWSDPPPLGCAFFFGGGGEFSKILQTFHIPSFFYIVFALVKNSRLKYFVFTRKIYFCLWHTRAIQFSCASSLCSNIVKI